MLFRQAKRDELSDIYALYQSVIGSAYCTWNHLYPGMEEVLHDFETDNLFVLRDADRLVGAASIVPENEMDALPFWRTSDGGEREIARIVIAKPFQGKGLAAGLVRSVMDVLKARGCGVVRLSVAARNIPALKTYQSTGFALVGETDMYDNHYYLLEQVIH